MTSREQLIREIEQVPDSLVEEVLDFLLFLKNKQQQKTLMVSRVTNQPHQNSVLDRMGGVPPHLISDGNLSDRDTRRAVIASRLQDHHQQRQ
ncbi:MAG: DUF2281 domain-containing protein [Elainellaceae cyanobacterium]